MPAPRRALHGRHRARLTATRRQMDMRERGPPQTPRVKLGNRTHKRSKSPLVGRRLNPLRTMSYDHVYRRSLREPEAFWADAAAAIDWDEPWQRVLDDTHAPFYRWFSGGRMNTCHNALDRHVEDGRADQLALVYDSPVTDAVATLTYRELRDTVARFAGALAAQGVDRGDRVIIYMPMVPEAVVAMLACARLGAIHSVVFGGFAAQELATRIADARPKVVVSASCGIEPGRLVAYKPPPDASIHLC